MKVAIDEIAASTRNLSVNDASASETSNAALEQQSTSSQSSDCDEEFVNTGLHRWEQIRHEWLLSCKSPSTSTHVKRHASSIDVDEVIDLIVSNRWRQQAPPPTTKGAYSSASSLDTARSATKRRDDACFAEPVSLPQMVDVLVDLWEAEGLDI
jgi:hypothetical protein